MQSNLGVRKDQAGTGQAGVLALRPWGGLGGQALLLESSPSQLSADSEKQNQA